MTVDVGYLRLFLLFKISVVYRLGSLQPFYMLLRRWCSTCAKQTNKAKTKEEEEEEEEEEERRRPSSSKLKKEEQH